MSQVDPSTKPGHLKFADFNADGKIDSSDRTYLGSSIPGWQGGISNVFTYRSFSFRVFFQPVQGVLRNNGNLNFVDLGGCVNLPQEIGYWTAQNASQDRPGLNYKFSQVCWPRPSLSSATWLAPPPASTCCAPAPKPPR